LVRVDFRKTSRPARALKRYRLVSSRAEQRGARIKRFRLMRMEALATLEPGGRSPRPAR
jgi:hypothetical protein